MALKVELKPGERIILGDCVITNDDQRTRLYIEGDAPILREKDILTPKTANTPAKRVYLAIQLMYLSRDNSNDFSAYFTLVQELILAAPSMLPYVDRMNNHILTGNYYKALKEARALIAYEKELLANAKQSGTGLWPNGGEDRQSA
ncbi:MAG: flagellar biosynthesis repressor FlbT [Pseudomonadota bacterium]